MIQHDIQLHHQGDNLMNNMYKSIQIHDAKKGLNVEPIFSQFLQ